MANLSMLRNAQSRTGTHDTKSAMFTVKDIPIGDIQIKENIRKEYTDLEELMASIRQYGLLQPITVYDVEDWYVVKTGHRRFMAYKRLYEEEPEKYHSVRCIISDAQNITLIQLIENVQRVDLSQCDLYHTLNELRDQGMTLRQIADVIGKTEGYIKSLFVGVNELNRDTDLQNLISGDAGITIRDVAETKPVRDKAQRLMLLEERKEGKITRGEMREKVSGLSGTPHKNEVLQEPIENGESSKTHITIEVCPEQSTITLSLTQNGNEEQLMALNKDLRAYFSVNNGKYHVGESESSNEG